MPNSSFEYHDSCYFPTSALQVAFPWFPARIDGGSTDYYNSCYPFSSGGLSIPSNAIGYQYAKTGDAYAGFSPFVFNYTNYREYLEIQLIDSLLYKKRYCVQFYVSLADSSNYATSSIGAYFSNDSTLDLQPNPTLISLIPHISNPTSNVISDTTNWVLISGYYTANGGERFITIGNFYNDSNTVVDTINNISGSNAAYYYIDDVSVILCDSTNGINDLHSNVFYATAYPNPSSTEIFISYHIAGKGKLNICNSIGKIITSEELKADGTEYKLDLADYTSGIYLFSISGEGFNTLHGKFSVAK